MQSAKWRCGDMYLCYNSLITDPIIFISCFLCTFALFHNWQSVGKFKFCLSNNHACYTTTFGKLYHTKPYHFNSNIGEIKYSQWGTWGDCSGTCEGNKRERIRKCSYFSGFVGVLAAASTGGCVGETTDEGSCGSNVAGCC